MGVWWLARAGCVLRLFRVEDLRFPCVADEAAFKQSCHKQFLWPLICAGSGAFVSLGLFFPRVYFDECHRQDAPFQWGANDPRTLYFATSFGTMVLCISLVAACTTDLCTGRLGFISWEHVTAVLATIMVLALYCISAWHAATVFGMETEKVWLHYTGHSEMLTVLAQVAVVTACCMYMPIRSCVLWVVNLTAGLSQPLCVMLLGTTYPQAILRVVSLAMCMHLMQFQGARRHERQRRDKWLALRRVEEQSTELENAAMLARALQSMAGTLSDTILMLTSDLVVMDACDSYEAYFGKRVAGCKFTELLGDADRARFKELLKEASRVQVMQSMPAGLNLQFGTLTVQLCMLDTGGRLPKFIIGLHTVGQVPMQEGELAPHILTRVDEERSYDIESEAETSRADPRKVHGVESIASTTNTGHVFTMVERMPFEDQDEDKQPVEITKMLQRISDVGCREHWLVDSSAIQLLPGRVLGTGGFGVVVMASMRGTIVAAKLPRERVAVRHIKTFASVINELRVHRYIRHPNLVLFYGACIDPVASSIALLYELVRGHRLDHFVHQKLDPGDGVMRTKLLLDVASALRYLHSLRPCIVHGDIKTSNILVESFATPPRAKLLDFGLSRLLTKSAKPLGGTRQWMAPELLNMRGAPPSPMPSADVFSFGFLAYFVVTGREPCMGVAKVPTKRVASVPLLWSEGQVLHDECRSLCDKSLSFDPSQRPDMETLQDILLMWLPAEPEKLQVLGPTVLALLLDGVDWEEGLKRLFPQDVPTAETRHTELWPSLSSLEPGDESQGSDTAGTKSQPSSEVIIPSLTKDKIML